MAKLELNKEDTINLVYNNRKINANKNRYAFSSKYPWKCLGCLKELFISYNQFGISSIFCDTCKPMGANPNLVQVQYLRVLKDRQLELIESFEIDKPEEQIEHL